MTRASEIGPSAQPYLSNGYSDYDLVGMTLTWPQWMAQEGDTVTLSLVPSAQGKVNVWTSRSKLAGGELLLGSAQVTKPDWDTHTHAAIFEEDPIDPLLFRGEVALTEEDRSDYRDYLLDLGEVSPVQQSGPGDFRPFVFSLKAPPEVTGQPVEVTINGVTYALLEGVGGEALFGLPGDEAARALLAMPSVEQLAAEHPWEPQHNGTLNMALGVSAGMLGAGVAVWDGIVSLGAGGLHFLQHYNTISLAYRFFTDQDPILVEDQQRLDAAWEASQTIASLLGQLAQDDWDLTVAFLTGDNATLNQLGEKYAEAFQMGAELFVELLKATDQLDDYETGKIMGRAVGEIFTTFTPGGAALKSATIARVGPRLQAAFGHVPAARAVIDKWMVLGATPAAKGRGSPLLEDLFSLYHRARWDFPDDAWRAAEKTLLDPKVRTSKYGPVVLDLLTDVMDEVYTAAVSPAGRIIPAQYAKVPSYHRMDQALQGWRKMHQIEVHHTVPKEHARTLLRHLYPGKSDVEFDAMLDDMPGLALHKHDHRIQQEGEHSFHQLLDRNMAIARHGNDSKRLMAVIERTYAEWDPDRGPTVWAVARHWLKEKGSE